MDVLQDIYGELSASVTTYALGTGQTWPYVTYPHWDEIAKHAQSLTVTSATLIAVIIQDPIKWVEYTQIRSGVPVPPVVWELEKGQPIPLTSPGDYAPSWQIYVDPKKGTGYEAFFINYNMYGEEVFRKMAEQVRHFRSGVVSDFVGPIQIDPKYLAGGFGQRLLAKEPLNLTQQVLNSKNNDIFPESMPESTYSEPIFDSFEPDANIVAYIQGYVGWHNYFENILLREKEGIYISVRNSCNGIRSWLVKSHWTEYLGEVSNITFLIVEYAVAFAVR
jgi:hypothetical protein